MLGSATLTMVVSTISSSVAAITATLTITLRRPVSATLRSIFRRPLLDFDGGFDAHSGSQRHVGARVVDCDAHRYPLCDLYEVPGCVLRRHERVRVFRRRVDRFHVTVERGPFVRVD